jgi:ADP-ribose pyrophosphatase YjhB (NUDIX family)
LSLESKILNAMMFLKPALLLLAVFYRRGDLFLASLPYAPTGTKYMGTPWTNERTVSVKTIGETKFARCDVHTVRSEDGKSEINDWLFMEEMDAVNVAVVSENGNFVVFEQGKYGIPGITLSPVGGFVDAGEAPWESAKREVMEELGLGSSHTLKQMMNVGGEVTERAAFAAAPKTQRTVDKFNLAKGDVSDDPDWIFLGRYRTAANRGAGFVYTYLLKRAVPILPDGGTIQFISSGDDEKQKVRFLPIQEVEERTLNGEFQEIKWAATHALALMHLKR